MVSFPRYPSQLESRWTGDEAVEISERTSAERLNLGGMLALGPKTLVAGFVLGLTETVPFPMPFRPTPPKPRPVSCWLAGPAMANELTTRIRPSAGERI